MIQDPQKAQDRYKQEIFLGPLKLLRNDFKEKGSELDQFIYQELGRIIETLKNAPDTKPQDIKKSFDKAESLTSEITQTDKKFKTASNKQRGINFSRRIIISLLVTIVLPLATVASMIVSLIISTVISRNVKKEQTVHENRLEGLKK